MFLSGRLAAVVAVVSAAALLVPGYPLATLAAADLVLAVLAALDVVLAVPPARVIRHRVVPPVVTVGTEVDVDVSVANPRRRPIRVTLREAAVPSLHATPRVIVETLQPGTGRVGYRLRPSRRGRFEVGPLTVRTAGPLGLAGRQRTLPLVTAMKVYPLLRAREQVEGRIRRSRLLEAGTRSARVRGGGVEFDSLRDYHPDDEFRRINWAASARAGKPMTNLFREERNQQVLLLLDSGRTMAGTVAGASRFEYAIDAAVAVAALAVSVGDRVGALAFADRLTSMVPPRSDPAQPSRIVDALFDVEPGLVASDYPGAVAAVMGRYRRRALLTLFTDLGDEAAVETLMGTIGALRRRHLVLVAQVSDPELIRLASATPSSAEKAFHKAAAAAAEARRSAAAGRLRRLGAAVVDRPPGGLAGAVADEYLRVKAYGTL